MGSFCNGVKIFNFFQSNSFWPNFTDIWRLFIPVTLTRQTALLGAVDIGGIEVVIVQSPVIELANEQLALIESTWKQKKQVISSYKE